MQELQRLLEQTTQAVDEDIAEGDEMLVEEFRDHYFEVGRSALAAIRLALLAAGIGEPSSILDLPCGHGRVLRVLRAAFPRARLTACDINREAVDYCARRFDARPVYGEAVPDPAHWQDRFDLIWCGSLLTHLPRPRWAPFLHLFATLLRRNGVLVLTLHGRDLARRMGQGEGFNLDPADLGGMLEDYRNTGFAYRNYPGSDDYGVSLTSPSWILAQAAELPYLRTLTYCERGWADFQDVLACQRLPESKFFDAR